MGIHTVTLGPVVGPWVNKTRGYLQPLAKAHPDGMRIALLLFFFPYLASGTGLDFLVDWLNGLGISYVPPMPRQGTCRDCSKSTLVSAGLQGKHFNFFYSGEIRFRHHTNTANRTMLSRGNNHNHNDNNDNNDWSATNLYMRLGRDNTHCRRRRIYGELK